MAVVIPEWPVATTAGAANSIAGAIGAALTAIGAAVTAIGVAVTAIGAGDTAIGTMTGSGAVIIGGPLTTVSARIAGPTTV